MAELEQIGCGYSQAYLGQNLEPFYQADKAAGLITYDDAVFMFKNLTIKLNEINYYYGERIALTNSADLGQSITLAGYSEDGGDATAEMDYVISIHHSICRCRNLRSLRLPRKLQVNSSKKCWT